MKLKDTGFTAEQIKEKVHKYMIETYERFDFLAETADGMYLYDENGTPYLDFYAGIAVNSAGNCNPKVVAAVKDQLDDIMHTFNYPYTIPQALLAEKVCTTIGMDKIFYQNSGAEANEAMIKMARKYGVEKYGPHKYNIVTAKMGFHGRTFGAMSATGQPDNACQIGFGDMTPASATPPITIWRPSRPPALRTPSPSWWSPSRARAASIPRRRNSSAACGSSATRGACSCCWMRSRPAGAAPAPSCPI